MTANRPNILWYCTDQQRFDTITALGNPYVQTPNLNKMVHQGTTFTHTYCQSPICTPSRASFLTGMYPGRLHHTRNGSESFPDHPPLITKMIADSGYECGLIGKFHLTSSGHRTEPRLDDGYSYWKFSHAPRDDWPEGHDYADWVKSRGGNLDALRKSKDRVPPQYHQTTWATDRAIEFIKGSKKNKPWLLSVNIYDPHPPFIPPREYAERFNPELMPGPHFQESDLEQQEKLSSIDFQGKARRPEEFHAKEEQARYYAMIAQIDHQFGRLLEYLEQSGQRENTVIIFTSDHGEMLGDHGLIQKGCRFYEGLVRVPLIFEWPEKIEADLQSHALVELLDLSATILELTGVPIPDYFQGKSLLPILYGKEWPSLHRDAVRCEYYDALDSHFTGGTGSFATMYRDTRYKLSVYHGHDQAELYDLHHDPWEHTNLWDDPAHAEVRVKLLQESFDAHVLSTIDVGSRRIAPM
ncbi:Arylsulfatase [Planctomycetales bacterium 10988]|nr:Arylsulfatase [Planctomycetales bacterium 10988]